jgi:hypothetical protein
LQLCFSRHDHKLTSCQCLTKIDEWVAEQEQPRVLGILYLVVVSYFFCFIIYCIHLKVTPSIISSLTEVQAEPIASWVIRSFATVGLHDEEKR